MDKKEGLQISLKEYETLRAEILQRIGHRFTFLSLSGAVGASAFFSAQDLRTSQTLVLIISAAALFGVWWQLGNLIARCSKRIAEIERTANEIAGEPLLRWEHEGLGSKFFHKIHK